LMSRGDLYEATRPEGEELEDNHLSELLACKDNPTTPSFLSGIPAFLRDDYKGLPFSDYYLSQTTNSSPVLNHLKNSKNSELVHGMAKQAMAWAKRFTHSIENGDTLSKHVDAEAVL